MGGTRAGTDEGSVSMTQLVTGGAGFIGSNLVRRLLAIGEEVRVFDDLSTGSVENLDEIRADVEVVVADVRDPDALGRAMQGAEVVYHLAALGSVSRSVADPMTTHAVNATGTLKVLEAGRHSGVRRVVYASSSSVYGDTPSLPKHEGMPPMPNSPYAVSKLTGEAYCRAFANSYAFETVSLRFFNVFGPRQDPRSQYAAVIPAFASRLLAGDRPTVFGDGTQSRDFTFVENAVDACVLAAGAGPDAVGQAMNVGCGERTTLLELLEAIGALVGRDLEPNFGPPRPGDVMHSEAAISKAKQLIGYRPLIGVREGLAETLRWLAVDTIVTGGVA
jgi:UDP-glucose 4-epimerase